jgi:energy-coupling factor transport system permease protein
MTGSFYKPGSSALHRYDPRGKIALLPLLVLTFFLPMRISQLCLYLAVVSILSVVFLGLRDTLQPIRLILPILILVLVLTPPFYRQGPALLAVRGFTLVSLGGLAEAARLVVRFTGISLIFFLFLRSTDPDSLVLAFRWFGLPFNLAMVISIALEYIPYFGTLYDQVQQAHLLRSAGEGARRSQTTGRTGESARPEPRRRAGCGLRRRLAGGIPTLTSVLILSIRRIPTLAMTLESRGVGRKNPRTSLHRLPDGPPLLRNALVTAALAGSWLASLLLFP